MRTIRKKRRLLINLALVTISSILGVVFIEILLSLNPFQKVGPWEPGSSVVESSEYLMKRTHDNYGFRFAGFNFDKIANDENILLIGDSFVYGTGLSDNQTFAWLLNKRFNKKNIQFYNAGVTGANPGDYPSRIRNINEKLNVNFSRIFIFIFLGNDFIDFEWSANESKHNKSFALTYYVKRTIRTVFPNVFSLLQNLNKTLANKNNAKAHPVDQYIHWANKRKSQFARYTDLSDEEKKIVKDRYQNIDPRIREDIEAGKVNLWRFVLYVLPNNFQDLIYNMDSEVDRRRFKSTMSKIDKIIQENNSQKITLFLIPSKFQVSDKERQLAKSINVNFPKDEFDNLFSINKNINSYIDNKWGSQIDIVDLTPKLVATSKANDFYYEIDGHFNPKGAELMADVVSDYVLKQGD